MFLSDVVIKHSCIALRSLGRFAADSHNAHVYCARCNYVHQNEFVLQDIPFRLIELNKET